MSDNQELNSGVTGLASNSTVPQFATAEYAHIPGTERCRICSNFVSGEYFRVNNQMACGKCAAEAKAGQPTDSHAAFARGLLLAAGAAVVGLILYATFTIVTGFYVGYIALGVGWLVGTAMTKGANGMGGLRYQVAAALLTYAAISMAAVPIWISYSVKHRAATAAPQQAAAPRSGNDALADDAGAGQPQASSTPRPRPAVNMGKLAVQLVFIGLASPFLQLRDPLHGLIGLVILFVGIRIALRLTAARPLEVDGPYSVTG